jgi:hypothetical protein
MGLGVTKSGAILQTSAKQKVATPQPVPNAVVNIADYKNRDVVRVCERLLEKALAGEITGLIYTLRMHNEDHAVSAVGIYAKDASIALPALERISQAAAAYVKANSPIP